MSFLGDRSPDRSHRQQRTCTLLSRLLNRRRSLLWLKLSSLHRQGLKKRHRLPPRNQWLGLQLPSHCNRLLNATSMIWRWLLLKKQDLKRRRQHPRRPFPLPPLKQNQRVKLSKREHRLSLRPRLRQLPRQLSPSFRHRLAQLQSPLLGKKILLIYLKLHQRKRRSGRRRFLRRKSVRQQLLQPRRAVLTRQRRILTRKSPTRPHPMSSPLGTGKSHPRRSHTVGLGLLADYHLGLAWLLRRFRRAGVRFRRPWPRKSFPLHRRGGRARNCRFCSCSCLWPWWWRRWWCGKLSCRAWSFRERSAMTARPTCAAISAIFCRRISSSFWTMTKCVRPRKGYSGRVSPGLRVFLWSRTFAIRN